MNSKKSTTKMSSKTRNLVTLAILLAVSFSSYNAVTSFVAYPTEQHRSIARGINDASGTTLSGADYKPEKTAELSTTQENQYTTNTLAITGIIGFILYIAIVGYLYHYIRTKRLAKNPVYSTVNIAVVATLASTFVGYGINALYLGITVQSIPIFLGSILLSVLLTLGFTLLIAYTFKSRYDRKHSFEID